MFATPVAPSGWPFESSPPETFTGHLPPCHGDALVDQLAGLAVAAQAEVLVVEDLGGREAVVELDQVEVLGADPGHLVRLLGGQSRAGVDVGHHEVAIRVRVAGEHRGGDPHGASHAELAGLLLRASTAAAAPSTFTEHISLVFG